MFIDFVCKLENGHLIRYHLILAHNFNVPARVLDVGNHLQKLIQLHMLHLTRFQMCRIFLLLAEQN